MTEQEAMIRFDFIRCALLGGTKPEIIPNEDNVKLMDIAIKALEEIQRYRELERKLNGVDLTMLVNTFMEMAAEGEIQGYQRGRILTNEDADKWDAYLAIGTPEEFRKCMDILSKSETNELSKIIDEWLLYQKLGSVDECREAVEKQKEMIAYCDENDCSDCPFHNTNQKYNKCMNDFIADEIVKGGVVNE